mmetsp:Transcript_4998/g.6898  ORF Transcript_4998/g.6898 Transcript_4998/m.6898 type:complete len:216 (-) Transcript_4998:236-883(-)
MGLEEVAGEYSRLGGQAGSNRERYLGVFVGKRAVRGVQYYGPRAGVDGGVSELLRPGDGGLQQGAEGVSGGSFGDDHGRVRAARGPQQRAPLSAPARQAPHRQLPAHRLHVRGRHDAVDTGELAGILVQTHPGPAGADAVVQRGFGSAFGRWRRQTTEGGCGGDRRPLRDHRVVFGSGLHWDTLLGRQQHEHLVAAGLSGTAQERQRTPAGSRQQ